MAAGLSEQARWRPLVGQCLGLETLIQKNHMVCPYQRFSPLDGLGVPSKGTWGAHVGRVSPGAAPRGLSSSSPGKPPFSSCSSQVLLSLRALHRPPGGGLRFGVHGGWAQSPQNLLPWTVGCRLSGKRRASRDGAQAWAHGGVRECGVRTTVSVCVRVEGQGELCIWERTSQRESVRLERVCLGPFRAWSGSFSESVRGGEVHSLKKNEPEVILSISV